MNQMKENMDKEDPWQKEDIRVETREEIRRNQIYLEDKVKTTKQTIRMKIIEKITEVEYLQDGRFEVFAEK